jgi:trigger factor
LAKSLGNFENLSALRKNISQGLKNEKEIIESQRIRSEILDKISEEILWEIPEILITSEKNRMMEDLKITVGQRLKISFEEYLKRINKSEKELLDFFQPEAERTVKNFLILKEIAKMEDIEAKNEEVKERISQTLRNYPDIEKAQKDLDSNRLKLYIEEKIKNEKTLQLLESFSKNL